MLFTLDPQNKVLSKTKKVPLHNINWKEHDLQQLLYDNLDELLPDDELLLIMQSRRWQEEPDLMAIDKEGTLYIFELKAWESADFNLLQVLRYGQIFGQYDYDGLNHIYKTAFPSAGNLIDNLNQKFETELEPENINQQQRFILITNGLDTKTRQAVEYWGMQGIQIDTWIYRLHQIADQILFEFETFLKSENPFEDLEGGYYILNTNRQDGDQDELDMLANQKAAAYFSPWKHKIEQINKGDKVFLYSSGKVIVAIGVGSGDLRKKNFRDNPEYFNEEFYTKLKSFKELKHPLPAREIKKITGVNHRFMSTMFSIGQEGGDALWNYITTNCLS